jgi:hypothetical protein
MTQRSVERVTEETSTQNFVERFAPNKPELLVEPETSPIKNPNVFLK